MYDVAVDEARRSVGRQARGHVDGHDARTALVDASHQRLVGAPERPFHLAAEEAVDHQVAAAQFRHREIAAHLLEALAAACRQIGVACGHGVGLSRCATDVEKIHRGMQPSRGEPLRRGYGYGAAAARAGEHHRAALAVGQHLGHSLGGLGPELGINGARSGAGFGNRCRLYILNLSVGVKFHNIDHARAGVFNGKISEKLLKKQ